MPTCLNRKPNTITSHRFISTYAFAGGILLRLITYFSSSIAHVFCCKICLISLRVWHVSMVMNSCQWLDLISILCSGSFDLNITLPSSLLQPLEAGLEVESSQWGVLKMWRWKTKCVNVLHSENCDISTDNASAFKKKRYVPDGRFPINLSLFYYFLQIFIR